MASKYRVAIIGTGRMGGLIEDEIPLGDPNKPYGHFSAYEYIEETEVIAVANRSAERMQRFTERFGVTNTYLDYREMIEKEAPDIVSISTRAEERAEVVIGVAQTGVKAIYATKPMCRTLVQADAMIEACARTGTILAIACHLNWYNWYAMARQAIADGAIGDLRSMVCHCPHSLSNIHSHSLALMLSLIHI